MRAEPVDFKKAATALASASVRPRWAAPGMLSELGMQADYGQDEVMTQTHTDFGPDDVGRFDTRDPSGGTACMHVKVLPGMDRCPDCGAEVSSSAS